MQSAALCCAKDLVDLFGEPGFVAELEGDRGSIRCSNAGSSKEGAEAFSIRLEVGRKLEEEGAELAGLSHRLKRRDELSHVVLAISQPPEVGDALGSLEAEAKVAGVAASQPSSIFAVGSVRKV